MDYATLTAGQLADALDAFAARGNNTARASMLDEAALGFVLTRPSEALTLLERAFCRASRAAVSEPILRASRQAHAAAAALAGALRKLGDYQVPRCHECGMALVDGECDPEYHTAVAVRRLH